VPTEEADAEKMAALRQARCLCPTWRYHTLIPRDGDPGPLCCPPVNGHNLPLRMFTHALAHLTIPLTHPTFPCPLQATLARMSRELSAWLFSDHAPGDDGPSKQQSLLAACLPTLHGSAAASALQRAAINLAAAIG
jgi:hypothetical protein